MLGAASGVGIDHNSDYYERASTTMAFGICLFPRINIIRVILLNIIHFLSLLYNICFLVYFFFNIPGIKSDNEKTSVCIQISWR